MIGKYDRDEVKPTVDVIKKLADVLDTTISYLMGETDNKNAFKAPTMFKRISDIESLPEKDRLLAPFYIIFFLKNVSQLENLIYYLAIYNLCHLS